MSSLISKSLHCQRGYSIPVIISPKVVVNVDDSAVKCNLIISKDKGEDDSYESSDVESEGNLGESSYLQLHREMDEELQLAVKKIASSSSDSTLNNHNSFVKSSSGVSENSFFSTGSYSPELSMTLIRPDPKPPRTVPRRPPAATVIGTINIYSPDDEDILSLCTSSHWMYNSKTSHEIKSVTSPFEKSHLVGLCSDRHNDVNTTVDREDDLLEDSLYNGDCSDESFSSGISSDSNSFGFIGHEIEVLSTNVTGSQFSQPSAINLELHEKHETICSPIKVKNDNTVVGFDKFAKVESVPSKRARFDISQRVEEQRLQCQGRSKSCTLKTYNSR